MILQPDIPTHQDAPVGSKHLLYIISFFLCTYYAINAENVSMFGMRASKTLLKRNPQLCRHAPTMRSFSCDTTPRAGNGISFFRKPSENMTFELETDSRHYRHHQVNLGAGAKGKICSTTSDNKALKLLMPGLFEKNQASSQEFRRPSSSGRLKGRYCMARGQAFQSFGKAKSIYLDQTGSGFNNSTLPSVEP